MTALGWKQPSAEGGRFVQIVTFAKARERPIVDLNLLLKLLLHGTPFLTLSATAKNQPLDERIDTRGGLSSNLHAVSFGNPNYPGSHHQQKM